MQAQGPASETVLAAAEEGAVVEGGGGEAGEGELGTIAQRELHTGRHVGRGAQRGGNLVRAITEQAD